MKFILSVALMSLALISCDGSGGNSLLFGGVCEVPVNEFCIEYDSDITSSEAETGCEQQADRIIASDPVFVPGSVNSCSTTSELARCVVADEDYVLIYESGGAWSSILAQGDCINLGGQYVSY